jgi:hypothetical protein
MKRATKNVGMLLLYVGVGCGCEAVPDITYVADDSGVDGNTCPAQVPSYATECCGPIPCFGPGCSATCTDCQKCSALDLCCPTPQHVAVCKSTLVCQ